MSKYSQETTEVIVKLIAQGKSVASACRKAGIDHSTYYEWIHDPTKPEFAESIRLAKKVYEETLPDTLSRSLFVRAVGGYVDETSTELATDDDGRTYIKRKVIYHRYVAPDVGALIFALTNIDPVHWTNTQRTEITGKDGRDLHIAEIDLDALTVEQKQAVLSIGEEVLRRLE